MIIPENLFVAIDLLVIGIFLFCLIKAIKNGFLYELINLIFLALSFVAGWFVSPVLANNVSIMKINSENELNAKVIRDLNIQITVNTIIWFIIIILILNLIFILIRPLFKSICKLPLIGPVNRILGIILGVFRAFVITILLSILLTMPVIKNAKQIKNETVLVYVDKVTDISTKFIINNINLDNIKKEIEDFDVDEARNDLNTWLIEQGIINE